MKIKSFTNFIFKIFFVIIGLFLFLVIAHGAFSAYDEYKFYNSKPDAKAILEEYFPREITSKKYIFLNAERVKWMADGYGGGRTIEGGTCAIISLSSGDDILKIRNATKQKFLLNRDNQINSNTYSEQYLVPSYNICSFIEEKNWIKSDWQLLESSGTCDGKCDGEFQEWSLFYNQKLNQILIEYLDYDGDHANYFP